MSPRIWGAGLALGEMDTVEVGLGEKEGESVPVALGGAAEVVAVAVALAVALALALSLDWALGAGLAEALGLELPVLLGLMDAVAEALALALLVALTVLLDVEVAELVMVLLGGAGRRVNITRPSGPGSQPPTAAAPAACTLGGRGSALADRGTATITLPPLPPPPHTVLPP